MRVSDPASRGSLSARVANHAAGLAPVMGLPVEASEIWMRTVTSSPARRVPCDRSPRGPTGTSFTSMAVPAWIKRNEEAAPGSWTGGFNGRSAAAAGMTRDWRSAVSAVASRSFARATRQRHGEHHDRDQTQEGRDNRRLVRFDRSAHDLWVPKNCTQPARKLDTRGEDSQILADQLGQGSTRKMPHIPFWSWPADMLR